MAGVTLDNVKKIYPGNVEAVKGFNLDISDKEFLVLVGPSGCGKSTTLRMVAGLEDISSGTIKIGDTVVNDLPPKDRDIAMVFQNYALYPHMTVAENMGFALKLRNMSKDDIRKSVEEAASVLGLTDYLDRRPKALSGGQRQRVAVGRAIVRNPKVFLFDEPLSNLDAKMRVDMRAELMRLHQKLQTTMIYVTHDQIEAMTLGNRIVVMDAGLIMQADTPANVYNDPANVFVARFIGTPPMNLFKGNLIANDGRIIFDSGMFEIDLTETHQKSLSGKSGPVYFGVRPEDFIPQPQKNGENSANVTGRIDVTEMLGNELIAHLLCGEHRYLVRIDPHEFKITGDTITSIPRLHNCHVFDGTTGINLTAPDSVGVRKYVSSLSADQMLADSVH